MQILLFTVFWLIGLFVTSFTLIPVLIILAFGIPTTRKLENKKVLKENNGIIKSELISLTILITVYLVMILIVNWVFPNGMIGILFGGGMVFLFGIGQIGRNEKNIQDYVETNERHFLKSKEAVRDVIRGW